MVSVTIASVIELAGRKRAPETVRFVVEALVIKLFITTEEVVNRLVDVTFVNTPVEATVAPIGVLLIVPLSIVRPSTTIGSVIALLNKLREPETTKLVILPVLILELLIVVALKVLEPINTLFPASVGMLEVPLKLLNERPVILEPVKLTRPFCTDKLGQSRL